MKLKAILIGAAALVITVTASVAITSQLLLAQLSSANQGEVTESPVSSPTPSASPSQASEESKAPVIKPTSKPKAVAKLPELSCSKVTGWYWELKSYLENPGQNWRFPSELTPTISRGANFISSLDRDFTLTDEQKYQASKTAGLFFEIKTLSETVNSQRYDLFVNQSLPKLEEAGAYWLTCEADEG